MNNGIWKNNLQSEVIAIGGVEEVTGTNISLNIWLINGWIYNIEIDWWKFQWINEYKNNLKNKTIPHAIILTHLHIDHSGWLIFKFANGYNSHIYTTKFNAKMLPDVWIDGLKIDTSNQRELMEKNKRLIEKYKEACCFIMEYGKYLSQDKVELLSKNWFTINKVHNNSSKKVKKFENFEESDSILFDEKLIKSFNLLYSNGCKLPWVLESEIRSQVPWIWYNKNDIDNAKKNIKIVDYNAKNTLFKNWIDHIYFTMINAWHLLWSAQVIVTHEVSWEVYKTYLFSWDLGRKNDPFILKAPALVSDFVKNIKLNFVSTEATYGNKNHTSTIKSSILWLKNEINSSKWNVIIPVFSNGRWQEIPYKIHKMIDDWEIQWYGHDDVITEWMLLERFANWYAAFDTIWLLKKWHENAYIYLANISKPQSDSKNQNKIYISSGGMMNWGFVMNHLEDLHNPNVKFIFVWYQAEGTKWNDVVNNPQKYAAKIVSLSFSWHADQNDLVAYFDDIVYNNLINKKTKILIQHGDYDAKKALSEILFDRYQLNKNQIRVPSQSWESRKV